MFWIVVYVNMKKSTINVHLLQGKISSILRTQKKFYLSSGNSTANNQTHQDKGVHTGKDCDSKTVRETTR